jgi:hypothetical protein
MPRRRPSSAGGPRGHDGGGDSDDDDDDDYDYDDVDDGRPSTHCRTLSRALLHTVARLTVPVRLVFSLLSLMAIGLVLMCALTVFATLIFGLVLPAVAHGPPTSSSLQILGTEGLIFVAVFAAVLVVETAIFVIKSFDMLISHIGFLAWWKRGWKSMLAVRIRDTAIPLLDSSPGSPTPPTPRPLRGLFSVDRMPLQLMRAFGSSSEKQHAIPPAAALPGQPPHGRATKKAEETEESESAEASPAAAAASSAPSTRRQRAILKGVRTAAVVSEASDTIERVLALWLFLCILISLLLATVWTPSANGQPEEVDSATASRQALDNAATPSIGFEAYGKSFVRLLIMVSNISLFFGALLLLWARSWFAIAKAVAGWFEACAMEGRPRWTSAALLAAGILASPLLLLLLAPSVLVARFCLRHRRLLPASCVRANAAVLNAAGSIPKPSIHDRGVSEFWGRGGVGSQAVGLILFGAGRSSYENFLKGLRRYHGAYVFLWFVGALIYAAKYPLAVLGVGFVGVTGSVVALLRPCRRCRRAFASAATSAASHIHIPGKNAAGAPVVSSVAPTAGMNAAAAAAEGGADTHGAGAEAGAGATGETVPPAPVAPLPPIRRTASRAAVNAAALSDIVATGDDVENAVDLEIAIQTGQHPHPHRHHQHREERGEGHETGAAAAAAATAGPGAATAVGGSTGLPPQLHPLAAVLRSTTKSSILGEGADAVEIAIEGDGVDVPCAWGGCMFALTIVAMLAGFAAKPFLGTAMLFMLLFLAGSWCLHQPPEGIASRVCRIILVLVAAVYGVFTSSYATPITGEPLMILDPGWSMKAYSAPAGLSAAAAMSASASSSASSASSAALLPGVAARLSSRQYDICDSSINGLAILDHCFLAATAYRPAVQDDDVFRWFNASNQTMIPLGLNASRTGVGVTAFYGPPDASTGVPERVYVTVRGTATARDVSQDGLLWQEAVVWSLISSLGPFSSWPTSVAQSFIGMVGNIEQAFGVEDQLSYADELRDLAGALVSRFPNASLSFSGHSLGGGLSTIVGQLTGASSVSFSGPGMVMSAVKFGLPRPLSYDTAFVVIPDNDVVPRIDVHVGTRQDIRCLKATEAVKCHSIVRTCCELARNCGDPYGRSLSVCRAL